MNIEEEEKPASHQGVLKGILYSNAFAVVAFAIAYAIGNWYDLMGGIISSAEFVLVPIGMGMIAIKYWLHPTKRLASLLPLTVVNTLIAILLSAVVMQEGAICLLIVSPLLLGFMWVGIFIGKYIYTRNNTKLKVSTIFIYIGLFIVDVFAYHGHSTIVSDEIVINAPRDIVWRYVAAHPENTVASDYWLFAMGLPCPVQSTVSGDSVGSQRKCIFSNGATFDEVVVENTANSVFTFDILKQPEDPEIIGHINIERGQFILKSNTDGTTTLTGNSWYTLKVYPAWYYDLWAVDITRNVHLRVMEHIKKLAESDVQADR